MDKDNNKTASQHDEVITPIDFTPHDSSTDKFSITLSPVKIGIGVLLLCFILAGWFVLSARSVFIDAQPFESLVEIHSPLAIKIGPRYLALRGDYDISVTAPGYYAVDTTITVQDDQAQTFQIQLLPLPGYLNVDGNAEAATCLY